MPFGVRPLSACLRRLALLTLLPLVALAATSCSVVDSLSRSMALMTPEQEVRFGAQVARQVEQRIPLVHDPAIVNYVREVGGRVALISPHSDVPIRFFVVQDDSINAFAIPGGNIYVNTGLIRAADDESELASVIAHEIGHVVRRHSARQISHTEFVNTVQQVIKMGGNAPQAAQLVSSMVGKGVLFNFSREDENEADTIAVRTLYNAGYDPQGLKRLFTKLVQTYGDNGPSMRLLDLAALASSHPNTRERIIRVDAIARSLPPRKYPPVTQDLRRIQGRLKELKLIQ